MIVFFALHLVISFLYCLLIAPNKGKEGIYRFIMVLFIPFFGLLFFILLQLFVKSYQDISEIAIDDSEILSKEVNYEAVEELPYIEQVNVIPIEEALIINSSAVKRKLLIDIFKEDVLQYMDFIEQALNDEDTETSHYAATAVLDSQRRFTLALQDFAVRYEKNRTDIDILLPYSEVLKVYLNSKLLDERNYKKYKYIYAGVLADILSVNRERKYYIYKINCDIDLVEYDRVREYCNEFIKVHPNSEEPYLLYLKYFYIMRDFSSFNKMMEKLKKSTVRFSNKSLSLVRYWSEVADEQ